MASWPLDNFEHSTPLRELVIVTDYDGPGLREEARQAGACGYVLKERLLDVRPLLERASDIK